MALLEKKMLIDNNFTKNANTMRPVRWDLEEAVALFSLYFQEDGKVPTESVQAFSEKCQRRAKLLGMCTNEKYRNETGIKMQIHCIEYIVTEGKYGLPNASKLFYDTYELYNSNHEKFQEIATYFEETYGSV